MAGGGILEKGEPSVTLPFRSEAAKRPFKEVQSFRILFNKAATFLFFPAVPIAREKRVCGLSGASRHLRSSTRKKLRPEHSIFPFCVGNVQEKDWLIAQINTIESSFRDNSSSSTRPPAAQITIGSACFVLSTPYHLESSGESALSIASSVTATSKLGPVTRERTKRLERRAVASRQTQADAEIQGIGHF